jgi:hypothetical protein
MPVAASSFHASAIVVHGNITQSNSDDTGPNLWRVSAQGKTRALAHPSFT